MKTLQQALDALPPEELKRRKRRLAKRPLKDGRGAYYFPGGATDVQEDLRAEYPRSQLMRPAMCGGERVERSPEYKAWAADPTNIKLYTALFYAANNVKA